MEAHKYLRSKLGRIGNKHFSAGFINGLGIGLLAAGLLARNGITTFSSVLLITGGAILWFTGLVQERMIIKKTVRSEMEDSLKK